MERIVTDKNLTVIDAAVLYCGDASQAYDIALLNEVDVTAVFAQGATVILPDPAREDIASQMQSHPMQPSAYISDDDYYRLQTGQGPPTTTQTEAPAKNTIL